MFRFLSTVALLVIQSANAAFAEDWPHWRGPDRNDVVPEPSGFHDGKWHLTEAWSAHGGEGSSSPLVAAGKLYLFGWSQGRESLSCLDVKSGKERWRQSYRAPRYGRVSVGDKGLYSGPSATPEYDARTGRLFTLGIDGDLVCWNTKRQGQQLWKINLYDRYHVARRPDVGGLRGGRSRRDYGYTTSPLAHRGMLIVEVGDTKTGTVKGFDPRTGQELWTSECRDEAGHTGGLVPMDVDGIPSVVLLTMRHLLVVRIDDGHAGETLAQYPWTTDFANNIPTPAVAGDRIIVTSAYNQYAMACLKVSRQGLEPIWKVDHPSGVCSPVIHKGTIYWGWRGLHAVDLATGRELWQENRIGVTASCLITSDDRLITWAGQGDLILCETAVRSPKQYTELARRKVDFRRDVWPHVVLADQRLYCKDRDGNIRCFTLGTK